MDCCYSRLMSFLGCQQLKPKILVLGNEFKNNLKYNQLLFFSNLVVRFSFMLEIFIVRQISYRIRTGSPTAASFDISNGLPQADIAITTSSLY